MHELGLPLFPVRAEGDGEVHGRAEVLDADFGDLDAPLAGALGSVGLTAGLQLDLRVDFCWYAHACTFLAASTVLTDLRSCCSRLRFSRSSTPFPASSYAQSAALTSAVMTVAGTSPMPQLTVSTLNS